LGERLWEGFLIGKAEAKSYQHISDLEAMGLYVEAFRKVMRNLDQVLE
jgi:hypothetical protein